MTRLTYRRIGFAAILAAGTAAISAISGPGQAQELPGAALWAVGGCANCHGNFAAGDGDPAYPPGPNLRSSRLTPEQLYETIACGRPSTAMPYNLVTAYTETPCYALPLGPAPVARGADFTAEQMQQLVDFLLSHVVGVRNISRENCAAFFGGNLDAPACREYN